MIPRYVEILPIILAVLIVLGLLLLALGIIEAEVSIVIIGSFMTIVFFLVLLVARRVRASMRRTNGPLEEKSNARIN